MIYIEFLGGGLLGLWLAIVVQSEIINRSEKFKAGWKEAFRYYTRTNLGGIYVGLTVLAICLFLIPTAVSGDISGFENFAKKVRLWSIGIGIGSMGIGFLAVKKTQKNIDDKYDG